MVSADIISRLPYGTPFLFVDEILAVDSDSITGSYRFDADAEFYKGHFKEFPVTPGVILTETMAQIGLVCFGIYLIGSKPIKSDIAMTSAETEFLKPVFPGEKVTVKAEKIYFRFGKLKCSITMHNEKNEIVCTGTIAGIILNYE